MTPRQRERLRRDYERRREQELADMIAGGVPLAEGDRRVLAQLEVMEESL